MAEPALSRLCALPRIDRAVAFRFTEPSQRHTAGEKMASSGSRLVAYVAPVMIVLALCGLWGCGGDERTLDCAALQEDGTETRVSMVAPFADGSVGVACGEAGLATSDNCETVRGASDTCSELELKLRPAIRGTSTPLTISRGDETVELTADWSILFPGEADGPVVEWLRIVLYRDSRDGGCHPFVFEVFATDNGGISVQPGPVFEFAPCGPWTNE